MFLFKTKYIVLLGVIVLLVISFFAVNHLSKEEPVNTETNYISYVEPTTNENTNMFYVDLKGAVKKPGVYKVKEGTIVNDLINLAGGLKKNAYTDDINLSKKLVSQEVVFIHTINDVKTTSVMTTSPTITNSLENKSSLVNINTASINELTSLAGIGEAKALAIVAYRTQSPFKSIEEIKNVEGIGEAAFAKIKDFITI